MSFFSKQKDHFFLQRCIITLLRELKSLLESTKDICLANNLTRRYGAYSMFYENLKLIDKSHLNLDELKEFISLIAYVSNECQIIIMILKEKKNPKDIPEIIKQYPRYCFTLYDHTANEAEGKYRYIPSLTGINDDYSENDTSVLEQYLKHFNNDDDEKQQYYLHCHPDIIINENKLDLSPAQQTNLRYITISHVFNLDSMVLYKRTRDNDCKFLFENSPTSINIPLKLTLRQSIHIDKGEALQDIFDFTFEKLKTHLEQSMSFFADLNMRKRLQLYQTFMQNVSDYSIYLRTERFIQVIYVMQFILNELKVLDILYSKKEHLKENAAEILATAKMFPRMCFVSAWSKQYIGYIPSLSGITKIEQLDQQLMDQSIVRDIAVTLITNVGMLSIIGLFVLTAIYASPLLIFAVGAQIAGLSFLTMVVFPVAITNMFYRSREGIFGGKKSKKRGLKMQRSKSISRKKGGHSPVETVHPRGDTETELNSELIHSQEQTQITQPVLQEGPKLDKKIEHIMAEIEHYDVSEITRNKHLNDGFQHKKYFDVDFLEFFQPNYYNRKRSNESYNPPDITKQHILDIHQKQNNFDIHQKQDRTHVRIRERVTGKPKSLVSRFIHGTRRFFGYKNRDVGGRKYTKNYRKKKRKL